MQEIKKNILDNNFIQDKRGFSLIELVIVMIILGLLASLVGPRMFGKLDMAKQQTAKTQIEMLSTALYSFKLDTGSFPLNIEDLLQNDGGWDNWAGPYLNKQIIPKDPWGAEYLYNSTGKHGTFELYSYGADGIPDGEGEDADIFSWQ